MVRAVAMVIALAGLAAGVAGARVSAAPERSVRVPHLEGASRATAVNRLRDAGLRPSAFAGAVRYEPIGGGFAKHMALVRAPRAGARTVTIQDYRPGTRLAPGSSVAYGTQPAGGDYPLLAGQAGGDSGRLHSARVARGARKLTLGLNTGSLGCGPVDHVDVAMRARWVLVRPFLIGGGEGRACRGRSRLRAARLELIEPLAGRPVLERSPDLPDPSLVDQRPTPFAGSRVSPDRRSVVVYYSYGGCRSLAGSRVTERDRAVEVTLLQGESGANLPCPDILRFGLTVVRLPSSLGERRIVDGAP